MRLGSKRSASKRTASRGHGTGKETGGHGQEDRYRRTGTEEQVQKNRYRRTSSEQTQGTGGQETEGQGTGTDQKSLGTIPLLELFHIVHNKKFLERAVKMR